jgi:UDP-N-acetylmuramoylalanine--D-glutamate ligase
MKIGIVGWGLETQSAFRYFGTSHKYVIVNEEPRDDFPVSDNIEIHALSDKRAVGLAGNVSDLSYLDYLNDCDTVIYQPSAHKNLEKHFLPDNPFWLRAKTIQHIFFEKCPSKNIIGVTGTKGKGTTTTLIAKILESVGNIVHVGGNIGVPVLDLIEHINPNDWVALELSSFQLNKFPYSPHIAVHLIMMEEHIEEWHKTMDDYVESKRNIFSHQNSNDIAVYLPSNIYSSENVKFSAGHHIPYTEAPGAFIDPENYISIDGVKIIKTSEVGLIGKHNLDNICAAVTATWGIVKDAAAVASALKNFTGLEHRLELVGNVNGVKYYDDSFGTTPDTAIVAMDAFTNNKIMIIGGHDKGNPFDGLAQRLTKDDVKHIVFIGSTGQKILELAKNYGLVDGKFTIKEDGNSWTMPEIVKTADNFAESGDVVLLSTGCASFGLFKDYKDRGNQFKIIVNTLTIS